MRIASGTTDQYIYLFCVDATDFTTPETGLDTFTVYRSRNGGAAAAFTSPTINETDSSNMPGVYELLLDEDMTIDSGDDEQEMVFHISHAGMAPVVRTITLFRPKITLGNTLSAESDGDLTKVNTLDGHTAQTGDTFAALPTNFVDLTITDTTGLVSIAGDGLDGVTLPANLITAASIADDAIAAAGVADDVFDAVNAEVDTALADINLDHLVSAAVDTSFANTVHLDSVVGHLADVGSSATFDRTTDALEAIRNRGDAEWTTGAGGSAPTVEEIRQEMDSNSTQLAAIVADTDELQGDWEDGGRLDLILDARASQASVDGLNDFDPASDAVANVTTVATTTNLTNLPTIPTDWIAADGVAAGAVTKIQNGLSTLAIGDISGLEITELSSVPGASPTLEEALALLYMALRNRVDVTSSTKEIHNDAGSVLGTKNLSDDSTTYSEAKLA